MAISNRLDAVPGTRLVLNPYGHIGKRFPDPENSCRVWAVFNEFLPNEDSPLIRLRAVDQKGFVTFINEMDCDLLRGTARPRQLHARTELQYPEIGCHRDGWRGMYVTERDLEDDLHIRELELRAQYGWYILLADPRESRVLELDRYVYSEGHSTYRLEYMLNDFYPGTYEGPDQRVDTVSNRWSFIQKEEVDWEQLPWSQCRS